MNCKSCLEVGFKVASVERALRNGTQWASDRWARGSFAAARAGSARMRQVLGLPVGGKIYFAGEAMHPTWAGQLAGAYLLRQCAVKQIIRDFDWIMLS